MGRASGVLTARPCPLRRDEYRLFGIVFGRNRHNVKFETDINPRRKRVPCPRFIFPAFTDICFGHDASPVADVEGRRNDSNTYFPKRDHNRCVANRRGFISRGGLEPQSDVLKRQIEAAI